MFVWGHHFKQSLILHHYFTQNSKLLVHGKHLIKINWAVGSTVRTHNSIRNQMFWKDCSQTVLTMLWEMMPLRSNNNNNLTHFLSCLHSALSAWYFFSSGKARANKAVPQKHTQVILKLAVERLHASKADRGQINKAFGYFKKMTEEARRQPRAAPRLQHCVYLESYSWGEGKEQQSSNRARVIIFSPVCYGLVRNALSPPRE